MPFTLSTARLEAMLEEDAPYGDLTTLGLGLTGKPGRASLRAGMTMTVCCAEEAEALFRITGCQVNRVASSGAQIERDSLILTGEGPAEALHRAAKLAQTLIEIASGIATCTRSILTAAREARPGTVVACTRKHLPGAKDVMLKGVLAGGGIPHRLGLSDSLLVFAQHRAFLGREPPHLWIARLRAAHPNRRITVEVSSVDEALQFAHAGVEVVQCDKLSPEQVGEVVRGLANHPRPPLIAATGGVTEENAAAYARAGAAMLVTSAPYRAAPRDVKLAIEPVARDGVR